MADDSSSISDDLEVLEMAMEQANAAAQAFLLLAEGASILMSTEHDDGGMEENPKVRRQRDLLDRPGRGNTVVGVRADYIRGQSRRVFDNIRFAHHPALFQDITHFGPQVFDHLYEIVAPEIAKAFDLSLSEEDGVPAKRPRKRILSNEELFFLYLYILGGCNEGGEGVRKIANVHGVSPGTISRYFSHACLRCFAALKSDVDRLRWGTVSECQAQHDLVPGFPLCVGFVDGVKLGRWRPEDPVEQEQVYDGRKHCHCFAVLLWTDNFGFLMRLDVTSLGTTHDRKLFDQSVPYISSQDHFTDGEHVVADTGFVGEGSECVCPFKKGMGLDFALRGEFNRDIRGVRMMNEWAVGFITNRHRLFLGRWPFDNDLFSPAFETCALMANELFRYRGYALQTRERYAEKQQRFLERQ